MKTNLLTFCIFLGSFFSISLAYGDDIPTQGRWDDEDYRSITALPPTLSINNNVLRTRLLINPKLKRESLIFSSVRIATPFKIR